MELQELVERINRWKLRQTGEVDGEAAVIGEPQDLIAANVAGEAAEQLAFEAEQRMANFEENVDSAHTDESSAPSEDADTDDADSVEMPADDADILGGEQEMAQDESVGESVVDLVSGESMDESASGETAADADSGDAETDSLESFEDEFDARDASDAEMAPPVDLLSTEAPGADSEILDTTQDVDELDFVEEEK
jgi:hypothetical protein